MTWTALLVMCTVAADQSGGWRPGGYPGADPVPPFPTQTAPPPSVSMPPAVAPAYDPTASTPPPATANPTAAGSWWTQTPMPSTLAAPVTRTPAAGPHNTPSGTSPMRQAAGSVYPPSPPPVGTRTAAAFPSTAAGGEILPPNFPARSPTTTSAGEILPPSGGNSSNGSLTGGREILYETNEPPTGSQIPASYRGKIFVSAPDTTTAPALQPPQNASIPAIGGQRYQAQRVPAPEQLPTTETIGGSSTEQTTKNETASSTASDRWWPLLLAILGLFGSIGFNVYLGWIAWDLHGRYQDVVADLHDLENQFDERVGEMESDRNPRRESRRVAAMAG